MNDRPAPGGLPSLSLLLPPSVAPVLLALFIVYVTAEAKFLSRYRRVLIGNANRRTDPAPYRDYPDVSGRHLLLRRIVARLGRRGRRRRGSRTNDGGPGGRGEAAVGPPSRPSPAGPSGAPPDKSAVYYEFIQSWFVQKVDDDRPYEQFSEQLDRLGPGLLRPSPSTLGLLRLAGWSSADGPSSRRNADDDEDSSNRSSYESLPVLEGEVEEEAAATRASQDGGSVGDGPRCGDCVKNAETTLRKDDRLRRGNMDEFLSWAFFGTSYSSASTDPSKAEALEGFYEVLEQEAGLTFESGIHPSYRPRSFTLEDVRSLYRPYAVYATVVLAKGGTNFALRLLGFRRHACERGLAYWHRPPDLGRRRGPGGTPPPFLFFHGIAPGGHAPYAPMLLLGLLRGDDDGDGRRRGWRERHVFLFENGPISYALETTAVCEGDTVHGVAEAVARHVDGTSDDGGGARCALTVCGHSFGSCVVTWLLRSPALRDRIGTALLLDPVSICLSDPDVVVNFLYHSRDCGSGDGGDTRLGRLARFANETKIRLVASSELGIETYLRRSFAWYNSELWFEDVPSSTKVCVFLSRRDEIVNSRAVEEEISCHNIRVNGGECGGPVVEAAVWEDAGHANCVTNPGRWRDMRERLRAAEEAKVR